MPDCKQCEKKLAGDEVGLCQKLIGRMTTNFLCMDCLAAYFEVERADLEEKVRQYKELGCALFV